MMLSGPLFRKGTGNYQQEYSLTCPLHGNPNQTCEWSLFSCFNITATIINPFGVDYEDNGCTMHIAKLTYNYTGICFQCTAKNFLGSDTLIFNSIDFSSKRVIWL